jgi:SAM-dependent methyltransferase
VAPQIDRKEGRRLFGSDPAAYDASRPGHPDRAYDVLMERCGLGPGTRVLEIGPGTGQATRRLLELGADPLVVVEPDPELAAFLAGTVGRRVEVRVTALEDAELPPGAFDLAAAASSFHWVDEPSGLARIHGALRPGGWWAMWWTLFGVPGEKDAFMRAIDPFFDGLSRSPTAGDPGRPPYALDVEARSAALDAAGFEDLAHEQIRWSARWDAAGIRALYGTFSPIARIAEPRRTRVLDGIAEVAERDFGGTVERQLVTSLYTARRGEA